MTIELSTSWVVVVFVIIVLLAIIVDRADTKKHKKRVDAINGQFEKMNELQAIIKSNMDKKDKKKSTTYRCKNCGYEGYAYGAATSAGVSAPWCPTCKKNNSLEEI